MLTREYKRNVITWFWHQSLEEGESGEGLGIDSTGRLL